MDERPHTSASNARLWLPRRVVRPGAPSNQTLYGLFVVCDNMFDSSRCFSNQVSCGGARRLSFYGLCSYMCINRHYRYEQVLAGLLWKVDMKDVTLISTETHEVTMRKTVREIYRFYVECLVMVIGDTKGFHKIMQI
jgi:hypothetical protein